MPREPDQNEVDQVGAGTRGARVWLRRVAWAAGVWAALVAATVGLHRAEWHVLPRAWSPGVEGWTKGVGNTLQVASLPGWVAAKLMQLWLHKTSTAVVASAIGWGVWALAALGAMAVWERLRLRRGGRERVTRVNAERRAFLGKATVACGAVGVGGVSVMGAVVNPLDLRVTRYRVPVRGLPRELDGLRLVQLTDLHLGPRVSAGMVRRAVEMACELGADVYVLTGDYVERVDSDVERLPELLRPLVERARIGCVGVLGNHDHYGSWREVDRVLRVAGVRMVDNGRVFVDAGTRRIVDRLPERGLCFGGVQDLMEASPRMERALEDVPADMARIVLSHNPDVAEVCVEEGQRVDLLMCGHTHGGQVRLPVVGSVFVPSRFGEKYRYGLVQGPRCRVLVSSGVGLTVMPIRIGVAPEIVELTVMRELDRAGAGIDG